MNLAIVLVIAATLALVIILRTTLWQGRQLSGKRNSGQQIQPVDLEAFRNICGDGCRRESIARSSAPACAPWPLT
jgi:hypothetical protein